MSGATGVNKNMKPEKYDSRYSMRYYYGLLSGSLLLVGTVAGRRFFQISRSTGWSFLFFTTSVTGMYLTFASIQRLYNSLREPISEEAENSDRPFEHSEVHEKFDENFKKNTLHITELTDNETAEDSIVENAAEDSIVENAADEKAEVLNDVVGDTNVNSVEIIEDSTNQYGSNEVIVLKCESSTNILPEEGDEECTITHDIVAEDTKVAEVVANKTFEKNNEEYRMEEAIAKCNNYLVLDTDVKERDIEVLTAEDISFDVKASADFKNIVVNKCVEKDMKIGENEDNNMDCLTESEGNSNTMAFLKEYNIKDPIIEKIVATNINIPEIVAVDDLTTEKFDKGNMRIEIIEEDSIIQGLETQKFIEKDISIKNIDLTETKLDKDAMTIEIKFDNDAMTILDDVVKEAELAEKYEIIDGPLTDDVNKSKLSEESKINESNEGGFINEGERKNTGEGTIFEYTITTIEKDIKENEIQETIIEDINIEFSVTKDCMTGDTDVMVNENIKKTNMEKVASNDICTGHKTDRDGKIEKGIRANEIEGTVTRDINIEFPVAKDCITENTLDVMANENVKDINIEKVASNDICTEFKMDSDGKIVKDIKANEIEETIIEDINIEFSVTKDYITEKTDGIANENIKDISTEKVASKDICIEHSMNSVVVIEDKVFKDVTINRIMEDIPIKAPEAQKLMEKDVTIIHPVEEDVTEGKLGKDVIATGKMDMVKEARIEEITATLESLKDPLYTNDDNQDKLNKEVEENIFHQVEIIEEQTNEVTAKDIIETFMAENEVDDDTSIEKMDENESREMHMNIGSVISEEGVNQGKFGMEIRNNYFEEYNVKDSEIGIISKDISIKDLAFNDVIEDGLNKDDLKIEILEEDIKKYNTEKEVDIFFTINDVLSDEVPGKNSSENIIANASLEDRNIIQDGVKENVMTKCISIEDNVLEHIVEETFFKDFAEEKLENIVIKNTVAEDDFRKNTDDEISASEDDIRKNTVDDEISASENDFRKNTADDKISASEDDIRKNTVDDEISASEDDIRKNTVDDEISDSEYDRKNTVDGINSQCILVDKPTLIKDTKGQYEVEAITEEQNVNEALRTEFNLAQQFPKLADNPTAQHINQHLSNSTDELRFLSPNTASGIGVFFRKSNKTRLAVPFPNTSTKPADDLKNSKSSLIKQSTRTSIVDVLATNQCLNTSSNTRDASTKNSPNPSNSRIIYPASDSLNFSDSNVKSASSKYSTSLSVDGNVILDPKHRLSAGTSTSSVLFLNNQTCTANLPTGQYSSDSESAVVSLSQVPNPPSIQSPNFLDITFISTPDQHLKSLPDTITISAKDSSPVISDRDVSIPIQSQKLSGNISGTSISHLPEHFDSSSDKPNRESPKTSDPKFASFTLKDHRLTPSKIEHSHRSSTGDAFSHDRHSSKSPDIGNRSRPSIVSPSWSETASKYRHSFTRGNSPRSNPSSGVTEEDVFSRAADSPWASCEDIPQAGNTSKGFGRDIFSLARNSPWSSCGDVSSRAHHFKNTNDGDVFSHAIHSTWLSGSGTIFSDENPRKSSTGRSFSHRTRSRKALSSSGVPRVRHSRSPTECLLLPAEKSPTFPRNVKSHSGQPTSASMYVESPTGQTLDSVSTASLTVQPTGASVDR